MQENARLFERVGFMVVSKSGFVLFGIIDMNEKFLTGEKVQSSQVDLPSMVEEMVKL